MRVPFALLSGLVAVAAAGPCRPRTSSSALASTTPSTEVVSTSTSEISSSGAVLSTTTAAESTVTSSGSTDVMSSTTTLSEVTSTTTSTAAVASSTTSTAAVASTTTSTTDFASTTTTSSDLATSTTSTSAAPTTTTVAGFCIKAVMPNVANSGYHVAFANSAANLIMSSPNNAIYPTTALFNLDTSTGALTLNNTAAAGYQVTTLPPFDNQVTRTLRVAAAPAEYPLSCLSPDGEYASGSTLTCFSTGEASSGPVVYDQFMSNTGASTARAWTLAEDGYSSGSTFVYSIALYFGGDCSD